MIINKIGLGLWLLAASCCWGSSAVAQQNTMAEKSTTEGVVKQGYLSVFYNAEHGGRITQIELKGVAILVGPEVHPDLSGNTWWPAPQSVWNWPPPASINNLPYQLDLQENKVTMISAGESDFGVQLKKEIELFDQNHLQITYTATNLSEQAKAFGHWEITRVPKNGRVLFPVGKAFPKHFKGYDKKNALYDFGANCKELKSEDQAYFDFVIKAGELTLPNSDFNKLFADGKGWLAYQLDNQRVLIKYFRDENPSEIAPQQGEIEVYASPILPLVELEQHAQYHELAPQASSVYQVDWLVLETEKDFSISAAWVEQQIQAHKRKVQ